MLLVLAMPMVLARMTQSVMTFADALMVEHLGPQAIAASATGGFNAFLVMILPMGCVFIVQSFVSQLVGRGELDATRRYAWYGLIIAGVAGGVALALIPLIDPLLGLAEFSPEVRALMSDYMMIRLFSVAAVVGVEALGNWYGGFGNTWMALIASLVSMCCDLFLNWVLIYGNLGAPEMGVNGAALSSSIGSVIGLLFLAVAFWRRWGTAINGARPARTKTRLTRRELSRVVRFGLPNGLNWFMDFAAFQLFVNVVVAALGDHTLAALNVVIAINSVSFMPAFGLASAGAILAGQAIGRGDKDAVWPVVKTTLLVAATWMGLIGSLYFVAPEPLLQLFDSKDRSPDFVAVGVTMLMISAAWQLFDAIGITLSETLRAAGDTTWTATARMILAWFVFVPSGYLVVNHADGGPIGAMLCLIGYLALLAAAFIYRFRSNAWRRIELIEPQLV
ncbi:MAG: MATE family efflux transporter [Deltaproteobacteria bacterium]|nr:MATE family efflux transporter [Deltaproteobacteria bacterium]MDQ3295693.1 MATE family efflux transporter [Myxococcota bacterium]